MTLTPVCWSRCIFTGLKPIDRLLTMPSTTSERTSSASGVDAHFARIQSPESAMRPSTALPMGFAIGSYASACAQ